MRVLIIGCGYVGLRLGAMLSQNNHSVFSVRRSAGADAQLRAAGITPMHADITDPSAFSALESSFDVVINLVSSSKGGVDEYREVYLEGSRKIIRWLSKNPPKLYLYTSSTSVYAQADGSTVTEDSPTEPDSPTSKVLIETERELVTAYCDTGFPAIILRASGIYGPERGHLFKQFLRGDAVVRDDGNSWINMIHLDDLASSIVHLISYGTAGAIYNVTDDEPVTQRDFFRWLATRLNRPMPPSAPADPNRKRGLTNKRVSNERLRSTGFRYAYPTFREGYTAEMQNLGLLPLPS